MSVKIKKYLKKFTTFAKETESNLNAWKVLNPEKDEVINDYVVKRLNKKFRDCEGITFNEYTIEDESTINVWYYNKDNNEFHFIIEV